MCSVLVKLCLRPASQQFRVLGNVASAAVTSMSNEQATLIEKRDFNIRHQHKQLSAPFISKEEEDSARRKRMIYRSKQRGWLEVDLLLGSWAAANVNSLNDEEMRQYDIVLDEETINIYNYISGKDSLPPHLKGLPIVKRIQDYAFGLGVTNPETYADLKEKANLT